MTVLLWIALILAVVALIIISSPVRFGADGTFGKSKRASGKFWLSYMHPALFVYEYSSTGHKERVLIFGINPRWFRWKKRKRKDDTDVDIFIDKPNSISDINNDNNIDSSTSIDGDNIDIPVDKQNSNSNINIDDNVDKHKIVDDTDIDNNTGGKDGGDTLMARIARRVEHIRDDPVYTKTMGKLNDIKRDWSHGYLRDKAFRRKLFKWLRRALNCALTTVRFDRLKLRAAAGFADPSQTGKAYGYFTAAKSAVSQRNKIVNIEMEPVFTEERLEADIEFSCRTSIAVMASNALIMAFTFPYRRSGKSKKNLKHGLPKN